MRMQCQIKVRGMYKSREARICLIRRLTPILLHSVNEGFIDFCESCQYSWKVCQLVQYSSKRTSSEFLLHRSDCSKENQSKILRCTIFFFHILFSLLKLHRITSLLILLHFKIIQRKPKLSQKHISQTLQLSCHFLQLFRLTLLDNWFKS